MTEGPINVLLVEDNPADALLVRGMLAAASTDRFLVSHAELMSQALESLAKNDFDVVLLDLTLPDGSGLDTMARIATVSPHLPIVVMSGLRDENLAIRAVQGGAQDYLVKGHVATHSRLAEAVWGEDYPGVADSLKVHIRRLREKIETDPSHPRLILTRSGIGYSLVKPVGTGMPPRQTSNPSTKSRK